MIRVLAAVACGLVLSSCATEAEEVIGRNWAGARGEGPVTYFPAQAFDQDVEGVTGLFCRVGKDRRPEDCEVVFEHPAGWGFGEAALRMTGEVIIPERVTTQTILQPVWFCFESNTCLEAEWASFQRRFSDYVNAEVQAGRSPAPAPAKRAAPVAP